MANKLKITLVKSTIGAIPKHRKTVEALGLKKLNKTNDVEAAALVGKTIAKKAIEKGITNVVFDRGGFIYQGKVQALADAAREAGLEF